MVIVSAVTGRPENRVGPHGNKQHEEGGTSAKKGFAQGYFFEPTNEKVRLQNH